MNDLKQKTLRGGLAKGCSQGANFILRLGSLMILARLLDPKDFGLVGMVTAVIGIFNVFKDFGLSAATVQRKEVNEEQTSALFWINLIVGASLGIIALAIAPVLASFYQEPRLLPITAVLAAGFLFNAAGVQHAALLERQMRFLTLSIIDIVSLVGSTAVGILMAVNGYGHWALVITTLAAPLVYTLCMWIATGWIPGPPRKRSAGVLSMVRFGGTVTLNGLVMYVASNFEKVLLGSFWGVDAIGIYGRAYQLINIPTDNLNSSAGGVAFAALSRLQDDPARFKNYFLKGYSLVVSLTIPITVACALFADDIIFVFLGPKWKDAAAVFCLLAPTALVFAMVNPLGWLMSSLGLVARGLKIAVVLGPSMIAGHLLGVRYGPKGVALCYSAVLLLWLIPLIVWAVRGTFISSREILLVASRPIGACIGAGGLALGLQVLYGPLMSPVPRLALGIAILLGAYITLLFTVMGQKDLYLGVLQALRRHKLVSQVEAT